MIQTRFNSYMAVFFIFANGAFPPTFLTKDERNETHSFKGKNIGPQHRKEKILYQRAILLIHFILALF